jgi:uncharacterized protein (TIGR02284 family)
MQHANPVADAVATLDHLLVVCSDGAEGYRRAARAVEDARVHAALARAAADREAMGAVLTNALVSLGHKPAHHGSVRGALHQRWIDAIGALPRHATSRILEECARGERETVAAFVEAAGRPLPAAAHDVTETLLRRALEAAARLAELTANVA